MKKYEEPALIFKVLSDPVRLHILDMLSCGELCGCELLCNLSIQQPTLSHHMKMLIKAGLVAAERRATWTYYSINDKQIEDLHDVIDQLTQTEELCVCQETQNRCNCSQTINEQNKTKTTGG